MHGAIKAGYSAKERNQGLDEPGIHHRGASNSQQKGCIQSIAMDDQVHYVAERKRVSFCDERER